MKNIIRDSRLVFQLKLFFKSNKIKAYNWERVILDNFKTTKATYLRTFFDIKSLKKMLPYFQNMPFYTRIMFNGKNEPIEVVFYKKES